MAADALAVPPSVEAISGKLRGILDRAQKVKTVRAIEPPLPVAEFKSEIASLSEGIFDGQPDAHRFAVVETAARKLFYETVDTTSIQSPEFVRIWDLLDILLLCREQGQCEPILAFYLIEELLDSQTTDGCRTVFDYLESRRERLVQQDFHKTNLALLRSCNELLKRLSRAEDAVFCGRIFFYLFQTFPLGDKSSVNLRGEFHVENVTTYERNFEDTTVPQPMDVVEEAAKAIDEAVPGSKAETSKVDSKEGVVKMDRDETQIRLDKKAQEVKKENSDFYPIFWSLQNDFSDPTRLFKEENFSPFKKGLENTLAKFRQTTVLPQARTGVESERGIKRKRGDNAGDQYANNYNPKYLTSRELFELELSDLAFQRHILVQGLILIDFLLSLTEQAKKKWTGIEKTKGKSANRALIYAFTLDSENEKWVRATRSEIAQYLQTGPEGKYYHRMVETVLARDKNWVRWKLESCPSIVKDAIAPEANAEAKAGARQSTATRRVKARPAGAVDVSFLAETNSIKSSEKLQDPSRYRAPSVEELLRGIQGDELDLDMAMDDEERSSLETSIANKTWRAFRAATRSSLRGLERVTNIKELGDELKKQDAQQEPASEAAGVAAEEGRAEEVAT